MRARPLVRESVCVSGEDNRDDARWLRCPLSRRKISGDWQATASVHGGDRTTHLNTCSLTLPILPLGRETPDGSTAKSYTARRVPSIPERKTAPSRKSTESCASLQGLRGIAPRIWSSCG